MNRARAIAFAAPYAVRSWVAGGAIAETALALLLGGGTTQGLWSDAFVEICSLPLLGLSIYLVLLRPLPAHARWPLLIIGATLLLPLMQLVGLPPFIWRELPGRGPFAEAYQAEGMSLPWGSFSLDRAATWLGFLSLLPALSVFLALILVDARTRRLVSLVVLGVAFASVLLGVAQLAEGTTSPLRFYDPTNTGDSVGFFANRNHYAALLVAAIPISAAWSFGLVVERKSRSGPALALLFLAYGMLLLGLGMAHSRAGLVLAFIAGLASTVLALRSASTKFARFNRAKLVLPLVAANLCGLVLAFQFGFVGVANRLESDSVLKDLRWPIAQITGDAIRATFPVGVGFGAFEPIYQMFELPEATLPEYVNHAHNDWLESLLDGGVPVLLLMLVFLFWYVRSTARVWSQRAQLEPGLDRAIGCAGPLIVGLLLLHSAVDYPLRTISMMVVFAIGAALMISPDDTRNTIRTSQTDRHVSKTAAATVASSAR